MSSGVDFYNPGQDSNKKISVREDHQHSRTKSSANFDLSEVKDTKEVVNWYHNYPQAFKILPASLDFRDRDTTRTHNFKIVDKNERKKKLEQSDL